MRKLIGLLVCAVGAVVGILCVILTIFAAVWICGTLGYTSFKCALSFAGCLIVGGVGSGSLAGAIIDAGHLIFKGGSEDG